MYKRQSQGEALAATEQQLRAKDQELADRTAEVRELEGRLADATAAGSAAAEAEQRISGLQEELAAATQRAEQVSAELEDSRRRLASAEETAASHAERGDAPASDGSNDGRATALEAEILALENRLEQTELRARHAYAEAESAQAELRFARERGEVSGDGGGSSLRGELAAALERAQAAEEKNSALRAELLLVKKGVDTDAPPTIEESFEDPIEDEGVSLRTRLSRAVDSKRATGDDDTHQWR